MISRYCFELETADQISAEKAYPFYSCLLSHVDSAEADALHEQKETPVSQYCMHDRTSGKNLWQICLLDNETAGVFSPILDEMTALDLNTGSLPVTLAEKTFITAESLIVSSRQNMLQRRTTFFFAAPTAFKQNGKYTVVPGERLIVNSLVNKWNAVFPEYPVDDADAIEMLVSGLHIADYSLRTERFMLKSNRIPGFSGKLVIEANLSAPIMEIWNLLAHFAEYSGIGIKTALGMGGVKLRSAG